MPTQIIQYAMIFYAIILLVSGYKDNSVTYSKKLTGYCLSFFMIAPLVINVYYLLFKLVDLPWILPFAVFDITPISISIALVFFIIPALKMRFLNLRQFANDHIFNRLSQGIISFSKRGYLQYYNYFCASRFPNSITKKDLKSFLKSIDATLSVPITTKGEIFSLNNKTYYLCGNDSSKKFYYLFIYDVTMLVENKKSLEQKLHTLQMIQSHLKSHATAKLNSEISKLKSTFAQDIHDIIGHSLTVFLASKESLISHTQISKLKSELKILENLFNDSIISINGKTPSLIIKEGDTSLESMFNSLETPAIKVHFLSEGKTLFLDRNTKNTLLRVAQESITNAIKHGNAKNIFIVIHYHDTYMKCLIHDDGLGCPHISPNMGLQGIQSQISKLHGFVSFGSDAQKGFYTDITFPI
jgi:signal transduction histidine kinase